MIKTKGKRRRTRPTQFKLNSLLELEVTESAKKASKSTKRRNPETEHVFQNLKGHLLKKSDKLRHLLSEKGAEKYYERLVSFGVCGVDGLNRLSTEHLNYLRIPGRVQQRLRTVRTDVAVKRSIATQSGGIRGALGKEQAVSARSVEIQTMTEEPKGLPGRGQAHDSAMRYGDANKENRMARRNYVSTMTKAKTGVNRAKLNTIEEVREEATERTEKFDGSNWLERIGRSEFDIFGMFPGPGKREAKFKTGKTKISNVQKAKSIACYECFAIFDKNEAIGSKFDKTQLFCSQMCLNDNFLRNKEICSICFEERNKLEMTYHFGEYICASSKCKRKIDQIKKKFGNKGAAFASANEHELHKIFNF